MERSLSISETRNSPLRAKLAFIPEAAARVVHKKVPWLTPNQVTAASALATLTATLMTEVRRRTGKGGAKAELVVLGVAQALDFFDGSLAREWNRLTPEEEERKKTGEKIEEKHNTTWGGMWDAVNDRWGAGVMGISRIVAAHRRGDRIGEFLATWATLSNPIPALLKARGESHYEVYPESSNPFKDFFGFFGVHLGRTLVGIPSTLHQEHFVQDAADLLTSVGNMVVINRRRKPGSPMRIPKPSEFPVGKEGNDKYQEAIEKIHKVRDDAEFRYKALWIATGVTVVAVSASHFILHKKK